MESVLAYIEANTERYLEELRRLLAVPSVSTNPENAADVRRAAEWLSEHMQSIGLEHVEVFPTPGHPIVYGDWLHAEGRPTVLLYGHYDVQPVEPIDLWTSPPFEAAVRNGRLYGRGTADDKGQIFIHLKSIEAFLKTAGALPVNLKLILEGEEEIGSDHLEAFVEERREMLKADLVLMSDTPFFGEDLPAICYGLRGLSYMQIDCVGPNRDLHSGSFGGTVHNPIQALAEIISGLHDRRGRVTIPGFYADVVALTPLERKQLRRLPGSEEGHRRFLGVPALFGEAGFSSLERTTARPTFEINGLTSGYQGEGGKTIVPAWARAKITMRLVPSQRPEEIMKAAIAWLKRLCPPTVRMEIAPGHGAPPYLVEPSGVHAQAALRALRAAFRREPVLMREGGSIPIVTDFKKTLGADTLLLGLALPDANAHSPNEKFDLDCFAAGQRMSAWLWQELAKTK